MVLDRQIAEAASSKKADREVDPWLLTPEQVAHRLNISRSKVYQLLAEDLESVAIGRSRRIRTSDLRRWLETRGRG